MPPNLFGLRCARSAVPKMAVPLTGRFELASGQLLQYGNLWASNTPRVRVFGLEVFQS
jgi:hypothetical protein